MTERILLVDDDPSLLAAQRRRLRKRFHLDAALGGEEALSAIDANGPYAVVVSDLRMPGMDGIQFLAHVRERAPDTVRVMLTGNADLDAAILAVNEGNIFRFLTKPVQSESFVKALEASLEQHRLITAERELLEKTLHGSIKVLTDIMALVNPTAFSRASRLKRYVQHVGARLDLPDLWQFELAAMLSQIGCVTLPPDILEKVYAGQPLSADEERMFAGHPTVGRDLIVNIPRLESIAQMIARQHEPFSAAGSTVAPKRRDVVTLGAQILKAALRFDQLLTQGQSPQAVLAHLRRQPQEYDSAVVAALDDLEVQATEMQVRTLRTADLYTRMILAEDIRAKSGLLLVAGGQEVTFAVLQRLRGFSQRAEVVEPFRVLVPRPAAET